MNYFQFTILMMIVGGGAVMAIVWFLRNQVSGWLDQKRIRPSQVTAVLLIILGSLTLLGALALPIVLVFISGIYALIGSIATASAIERLVIPPQVERRPPWYQGAGDPSWAKWPPAGGEKPARRFSMLWLGLFVSMLCVSMAALSIRYRWEREQGIKHQQAVARILQLGGTVQQGDVSLAGTSVKDDDLVWLADLSNITGLNLGATSITNVGLKHLSDLTSIQILTLSGTNIDDNGLSQLVSLPKLSVVLLRQTSVNGLGVKFHKHAPLQMLDLSLCPVTPAGLDQIAQQQCRHLSLAETDLGDESLEKLKAIDVENLDLTGTKISKEGLLELQAHRPRRKLRHGSPSYQRAPASER